MSSFQAEIHYAKGDFDVESRTVTLENGRRVRGLRWAQQGFELVKSPVNACDWDDEAAVAERYYAPMEALAQRLTGCDHALVDAHIARNPQNAQRHIDYAPIEFAHSDFTATYGASLRDAYRVHEGYGAAALARAGIAARDVVAAPRLLVLQLWRNVGPVPMDRPLAFVDAQTVPRGDLVTFHVPSYAGDDTVPFDTFGLQAPPASRAHRWVTFPDMALDEVVAFRTFDSDLARDGGTFWTPHTAFVDRRAGAHPRRSIEVRATCVFL